MQKATRTCRPCAVYCFVMRPSQPCFPTMKQLVLLRDKAVALCVISIMVLLMLLQSIMSIAQRPAHRLGLHEVPGPYMIPQELFILGMLVAVT